MELPAGVTASELTQAAVATVGMRTADALTAQQLSRWLVEQQLATRAPDGRLAATALGAQLGAALRPLEGNAP